MNTEIPSILRIEHVYYGPTQSLYPKSSGQPRLLSKFELCIFFITWFAKNFEVPLGLIEIWIIFFSFVHTSSLSIELVWER